MPSVKFSIGSNRYSEGLVVHAFPHISNIVLYCINVQ